MRYFHDGDDDQDDKKGGPGAGDYTPPDDLTVPGESKGLDESQQ